MTELLMRAGTRLDDLDETDAVAAQSGGPAPGDAGVALATGSAAQAGTSTRPSRGESTVALHGRKSEPARSRMQATSDMRDASSDMRDRHDVAAAHGGERDADGTHGTTLRQCLTRPGSAA